MRVLAHHAKRRARSKASSSTKTNKSAADLAKPAANSTEPNTKQNEPIMNGISVVTNSNATPKVAQPQFQEAVMLANGTAHISTHHPTPENKRSSVRKQLEGIYRQQSAELVLELKNIRKKLNFNSNRRGDGEPDRKRIKRDTVRCHCHVAIWDNREVFRSPEPIVNRSQLCTVTTQGGPEDCQSVDIEMDDVFRIKASEMHVPVKTSRGFQMTWGERYFLEIKIIPCELDDIWPPFKVLSKVEGTVTGALGKRSAATVQGALVSSYANLPQAPASNVPLSVSFVQDGTTLKTKFGLEVASTWTISTYNDLKVNTEETDWLQKAPFWTPTVEKIPLQTKTAIHTDDSQPVAQPEKVVVSYRLDLAGSSGRSRDCREAKLDGYSCVACRKREYESLTDLLFHLSTYHLKYKYTVEQEEKNPVSGEPKYVAIKIDVADPERKKPLKATFKNPDTEIGWVSPKRPFDVDAYLDGDHTWTGHGHKKPVKAQRPALNGALASTSAISKRKVGFTPAEEVQAIPIPERKHFKVIPSRTRNKTLFYRSVSHRPMRLDESPMSESDDEIDDSWIRDKHRERIYEQDDLDGVEKEFLARWDMHIMSEHFSQGRYVADSLVRFVRKETTWLRQDHIWLELQKLIRELKEHDVIDSKVITGCFKILWSNHPPISGTSATGEPQTNGTHAKSALLSFGNGDRGPGRPKESVEGGRPRAKGKSFAVPSDPYNAESPPRPGSCGVCLKADVRKREAVACSGARCRTPGTVYHLACVEKEKRSDDWVCRACFLRDLDGKGVAAS